MYSARLKDKYTNEVSKQMMEKFQYKSVMEVPKITKIVMNQGVKGAVSDKKLVTNAVEEMSIIAGQRAVSTFSKKDISNFKLRAGMPIGVMVTLRKERMFEFIDRLVHIALPRVRDFRGINAKLDGKGNYTLGIREQIIFPEINYDKIEKVKGMNITFVTTAPNDEQGRALLTHLGLPFRKN